MMSPEVVIHIFQYLNIEDFIQARLVHVQWYDIINDHRFYKQHFLTTSKNAVYAVLAPKDGFSAFMLWYNKYIVSRSEVLQNSYGLLECEHITMYKLWVYLDNLRKIDTTVRYIRTIEQLLIGYDVIQSTGDTDVWELIYGQIKIASNRNGWGLNEFEIFKTKFYSNSPILAKYAMI